MGSASVARLSAATGSAPGVITATDQVPGQRAVADRGDDAGAEHRGLAGARGTNDDDRTALPDPLTEPSEDVGGHGVPAEEPRGVLGLVAVQPLVRRGLVGHPQRGRPAQPLERRYPGIVVRDTERIEDREEGLEVGEVREMTPAEVAAGGAGWHTG